MIASAWIRIYALQFKRNSNPDPDLAGKILRIRIHRAWVQITQWQCQRRSQGTAISLLPSPLNRKWFPLFKSLFTFSRFLFLSSIFWLYFCSFFKRFCSEKKRKKNAANAPTELWQENIGGVRAFYADIAILTSNGLLFRFLLFLSWYLLTSYLLFLASYHIKW